MKTMHLKIKPMLTEICWQDSPSSISELFKHHIEQKRNRSNGFSWNQFNQLICLFFFPHLITAAKKQGELSHKITIQITWWI